MPPTVSASDLARCDANYFESWRAIARNSDAGEVHDTQGVTLVSTGVPIEWANIAFITRPLAEPIAAVVAITEFFGVRSVPFIARVREGVDPEAEAALMAAGIPFADVVPGMFLADATSCVSPRIPGLVIQAVETARGIREWQKIVSESFGLPRAAVETFFGPRWFADPTLESYLGLFDGEPVAASSLSTTSGIAGVYSVGTLASHRRKGVGEAMTAHAVRTGAALGCRSACLQASEMGRPIYERMGFALVAPYHTFHRRPPAASR